LAIAVLPDATRMVSDEALPMQVQANWTIETE